MSIKVHFFASLSERLGLSETEVSSASATTALDVWVEATGQTELADNILIAVNKEYAKSDTGIEDGDEVAFFPPVTGG